MLNLPAPIREYLYNLTVQNHSPAYLFVTKDNRLSTWGGNLSLYGITNLVPGDLVEEKIFFLEGLLPINEPIFLPYIKTKDEISADLHIFPDHEGDWVLLLDASLEENQRSLMQQKGNELSLLRKTHSNLLSQHFKSDIAENIVKEMLTLQVKGERKDVTILFADVRGFTAYSEANPPDIVFKTLNLYLLTVIQPVLDEAGVVDKIVGDAVMALFGILPTSSCAEVQAIKAALKIIDAIKNIKKLLPKDDSLCQLDIGIGIASGKVALGIINNSTTSKTLSAIGYYVNLAVGLENKANRNEILIDQNTFNKIGNLQKHFFDTTFLDSQNSYIKIYSYLVAP